MHDYAEATLDDLAVVASAGNDRALDELLRRIQPDVLRRCGAQLQFHADAEEACQDALLQVARHIGTFERRSKFSTWLYVVVYNCILQTYRSLCRRSREQLSAEMSAEPKDPRTTSVIAGSRIDLLDALERLARRNPEFVAAFLLADLADLPYDDISAQLELPKETVRYRAREARKFVRMRLAAVT